MNKEEITCKIPNNQIHISKEKDEDCLIWISSKAINMSNTIDELQQQVKKQKEVIDRLNFIKNRKNQGASQENINKMAIGFVNSYLKEVSE